MPHPSLLAADPYVVSTDRLLPAVIRLGDRRGPAN